MAQGDAYLTKRRENIPANTTLAFTASTDDTTLITARNANHTIYVQRIKVYITTSTAATETFQDHTTGKVIYVIPANPGANTPWSVDFGPDGVPLSVGENLLWNVSATGHAGHLEVEAYQKQTVPSAPSGS